MRTRTFALAVVAWMSIGLALSAQAGAVKTPPEVKAYLFCTAESGCKPFRYSGVAIDTHTKKWGFKNGSTGEFEIVNPYVEQSPGHYLLKYGRPPEQCVYPIKETETGFNEPPEETETGFAGGGTYYICEAGEVEEFWLQTVGTVGGLGLAPTALKPGYAGRPYHDTLSTVGGTAPYTFTVGGTLPEGLGWNAADEAAGSIELVGTPTTAGTTRLVVEAEDAASPAHTVRREYTLTIGLGVSGGLGHATYGQYYSRALTASGGTAPYKFKVTGGSLPEGLELTEEGAVRGRPQHAGTSSFSITVTDSSAPAKSRTLNYTLTVDLALFPLKLPSGEPGVPYGEHGEGVQFEAEGGAAPYQFEVSGLPPGMTFEEGRLAGTPESEGVFPLVVKATDSESPAATATGHYSVKIKAPKSLPLGEWKLGYTYADEPGNENFDGIRIEAKGRLHDEDGAPGNWAYHEGHIRFTIELDNGSVVYVYEGTGPDPGGPFSGTWNENEGTFTLKHEPW